MSADPNKKSARTFQCRDVLWETFEQMARELECSIDYLINESMKQYARQRSYSPRTPFPGSAPRDGAGSEHTGASLPQGSLPPFPQGAGANMHPPGFSAGSSHSMPMNAPSTPQAPPGYPGAAHGNA